MIKYFKKSAPVSITKSEDQQKSYYKKLKWQVFISATLGCGIYYVFRLSLNVVKKPIVDAGILTESELGSCIRYCGYYELCRSWDSRYCKRIFNRE